MLAYDAEFELPELLLISGGPYKYQIRNSGPANRRIF